MGGGSTSTPSKSQICKQCACVVRCQICESDGHLAPTCPFIYTACKTPKCTGIRKILISGTHANPGRKFLKCQYIQCGSFQWLDDAVSESKGAVRCSSSPKQHREHGCFACGLKGHWKYKCPWEGSPCKGHGCEGTREVRTSTLAGFEGQKYLWCAMCEDS